MSADEESMIIGGDAEKVFSSDDIKSESDDLEFDGYQMIRLNDHKSIVTCVSFNNDEVGI